MYYIMRTQVVELVHCWQMARDQIIETSIGRVEVKKSFVVTIDQSQA